MLAFSLGRTRGDSEVNSPRVTFCIEQTLGHRAHTRNIREALANEERAAFVDVEYPGTNPTRIPWALRGSGQAFRQMRRERSQVAFYHTQTISLFAARAHPATPFVVSVDATPVQLDSMGKFYAHSRRAPALERVKRRWYRNVFTQAAGFVAWSEWAADSLVADYEVPRDRIVTIHPGASSGFFQIDREVANRNGKPRVLFVGGDFVRKGGEDLLAALDSLGGRAELTIVTEANIEAPPGVEVLRGVAPGSPALYDAFARADVFCLPTYGDCTPVVLAEAQAAGLPIVTTSVGSNANTVIEGETGFLIEPGDRVALEARLSGLIECPSLRTRLGARAREHARETMDATANARRLFQFATQVST